MKDLPIDVSECMHLLQEYVADYVRPYDTPLNKIPRQTRFHAFSLKNIMCKIPSKLRFYRDLRVIHTLLGVFVKRAAGRDKTPSQYV